MAQVSRFPLPKTFQNEINAALRQALADLKTETEVHDFLEDLLTPTEKIMLAKRLAIAFLLDKGYDQRTVHRIMKVSLSTVNTVNYWLKNQGRGYRLVINKLKSQKNWEHTIEELGESLKDVFSVSRQLHGRPQKEITRRDSLF